MKPKNFPTRKNQRRVEALERLKTGPVTGRGEEWIKKQIEHLEAITAKPLKTRTKKDRTSRAKLKGF